MTLRAVVTSLAVGFCVCAVAVVLWKVNGQEQASSPMVGCSSCDARHQRLQRNSTEPIQEGLVQFLGTEN